LLKEPPNATRRAPVSRQRAGPHYHPGRGRGI